MPISIHLIRFNLMILSDRYRPFDAHCCHTGTAIKHPVPDWIKPSFVICDIQALWRSVERQSAWMSKITGCFIAVPMWRKWASKG